VASIINDGIISSVLIERWFLGIADVIKGNVIKQQFVQQLHENDMVLKVWQLVISRNLNMFSRLILMQILPLCLSIGGCPEVAIRWNLSCFALLVNFASTKALGIAE
jgi:hypothetical protein